MARPSESLLSDGRRLAKDGACDGGRGKTEGHSVRRSSRDDSEACELLRDCTMGWAGPKLWLLSVRLNSVLVFRFLMISPPAMTTGCMRSMRKGSYD